MYNATTTPVKTLKHLETRAHVAITLATDHDVTQSVGRALACRSRGSGSVRGPCVSLASPGQSGAGTATGLRGGVGTGGEGAPGGASHGKRRPEHKGQESALNFQLECYSSGSASAVSELGAASGQSTCGPKVLLGSLSLMEGSLGSQQGQTQKYCCSPFCVPSLDLGYKKKKKHVSAVLQPRQTDPIGHPKPSSPVSLFSFPVRLPFPCLSQAPGFGWSCK